MNAAADIETQLSGSCVVDANGAPLVAYRGEHGLTDEYIHTQKGSISFGSLTAANTYALDPNDHKMHPEAARILPAYLNITNPVINNVDDPFIDLSRIIECLGVDRARRIARKLASAIVNTNNWHENFADQYVSVADLLDRKPEALTDLYLDAYKVFDEPEFVRWFREAGFDGAIHCGNGETAGDIEYKVFSKTQIIPAIGFSYQPAAAERKIAGVPL